MSAHVHGQFIAVLPWLYMIIPVVMNARADAASLVADPLIMRRIAIWGDAILVGVWGATLSSALGSILGAPRILQALARDNILPKPLRVPGRGSGPDDEPRLGTYVSLALALAAVVTATYLWLQSRGLKTAWGDIRQGAWQALVRWGLLNVRAGEAAKSWRRNFLVLAGSPAKRWSLIDFANSASHDRGILSVATILPEPTSTERKQQLTTTIRDHLEERGVEALIRVVSAPNPYVGVATLVKTYGLGSLVPNTVLMGDGLTTADPGEYGTMIARIHQATRSVVVVRAEPDRGFGQRKTIDVWLHGIRGNGALMITLAHLLATSLDWRGARITVRMIVENPEGRDEATSNLRALIDATRIEAGVEVLVDERPATVVISEASRHTDLTFIGLAAPKDGDESAFTDQMHQLVDRTGQIPTVAYVLASAEANIEHILA